MVGQKLRRLAISAGAAALVLVLWGRADVSPAARISDVRNSNHNLSVTGPGTVKATTETQVCVFCHTPHAATMTDASGAALRSPLWNRTVPAGSTYTGYTSSSLDAAAIQSGFNGQPGGSTKLCLSCHDGTLAIGSVNVLNGAGSATTPGTVSITMTGTGAGGVMPSGTYGATSGFTRNLGTDLTNDHPISVTYTTALADRDGELRRVDANQKWPVGSGTTIGVRSAGYRPLIPLEPTDPVNVPNGQVQCASCHDPHIRETDATQGNQKFLRQSRFQQVQPAGGDFVSGTDIICLACHDKAGASWAYSAHANQQVTNAITYTAAAATLREFPAGIPVWKAACMNCHDTHTVQGARRLVREGTDSVSSPKTGGNSAIEETCYQCHTTSAQSVVTPTTTVPNIKTDFGLTKHMPITSAEQSAGTEVHDIGNVGVDSFIDCTTPTNQCGKDFIESRTRLGNGNLINRHVECTDCHNPHRVVKFRSFVGNPPGSLSGVPDAGGTHNHVVGHTNIASGVLRGTWGVEPVYGASSFLSRPTGYTVKRGDPGTSADTTVGAVYVTREYQVCLKCHSDYGYNDDGAYPSLSRPSTGPSINNCISPGTPPTAGQNCIKQYSNQAMEFQAPTTHQGETIGTMGGGAASAFEGGTQYNHRSWHPVMAATGRTTIIRTMSDANSWLSPWNSSAVNVGIGYQTMYCTDCHGTSSVTGTVVPTGSNPWGPHGSTNPFILKGVYNANSGGDKNAFALGGDVLCFKCHQINRYSGTSDTGTVTGFSDGSKNLHNLHAGKTSTNNMRCQWCHIAVPHGWKNKSLLVNLNDIGPEGADGPAGGIYFVGGGTKEWKGTDNNFSTTQPFNAPPYYQNAFLKVVNFRKAGQWTVDDCGSKNSTNGNDQGRSWMQNACKNAP